MLVKYVFLLTSGGLLATAAAQKVTHRWSFNGSGAATNGTVIPDAISGAPGVIRGSGATRTGSALTLPGNTNGNQTPANIAAYFDLPNGILSSNTNFTIEIWATIHSARNWQRLFDFGRMNTAGTGEITGSETTAPGGGTNSRDNFMLAVCRGNEISQQRFASRIAGGAEQGFNTDLGTTANTQYHYVATYEAGVGSQAATGGRIRWYRNGTLSGSHDVSFRLSSLEDVNNWLGRSQFTNDQNANISYNEVRLHDHALTQSQISDSHVAGPDAAYPAPVIQPHSATMLHGRKARFRVLENATGEVVPASLAIDQAPQWGSATVQADGSILYTHTTGTPEGDSFVYRVANSTGQSSTATVTVSFGDTLKIANSSINVPQAPPATSYTLTNAFGNLSFSQPVCIASPPGDTQRVFVCEKGGLLKVVPDVTADTPTSLTFLNLPSLLTSRGESIDTGSESGLLGLAFHPDFATNRQFFIFYSVFNSGTRYQRVSRFTAQAGNPNAADTTSELILISQLDEANNHNGGDLHFGPDGYLYISVGDEGGGNDQYNNHQTITKDLFTGILRIDVDKKPGNVAPTAHAAIPTTSGQARFSIPIDNPYVHTSLGGTWNGTYNGSAVSLSAVRREFYATGLRNPWRMSFDSSTGELWCADVGQDAREEVNLIVNGGNYGWAWREGNINGPKSGAPGDFDSLHHTRPVYDYTHGSGAFQGNSVTGGVVYRGTRISNLIGKYIFADYGSGNIWSLERNGANPPTVERIAGEGGIAGFGLDPSNQDVLLADIDGNRILRLGTSSAVNGFPATLSATGLFADLTDLSPSPGLVAYDVNLPFWSDHAVKSRWFVVPDGASRFTWSRDGLWTLPAGTIWVKHFDMEMQRGVPESRKRIETRLIVKNDSGAYGVSYRWNEEGTEAHLAPDAGEDFELAVTENGNPAPQTWRIPSRAECMICHLPEAGHALSFNTRQLNLESFVSGVAGNQLATLHQHDYFTNTPDSPNLLPRHLRPDEDEHPVEARVRSYLAVNCAYCHQDGGVVESSWDGGAHLKLADTGLVNGEATNNGGDPANKLVVPGDPGRSIVLNRIALTNGFTRMPPVGSNVIDDANVALLTEWITGELVDRQTYPDWRQDNFGSPDSPEGDPSADPDGDGRTNHEEFLAGTQPLDGASAFRPVIDTEDNQLAIRFPLPANRSYRILTSDDLQVWTPWDIPGNQGLPVAGGPIEILRPLEDSRRFFLIEYSEN